MLLCVEIWGQPDLHLRFRRVGPLLLCILVDLSAAVLDGVDSGGRERESRRQSNAPASGIVDLWRCDGAPAWEVEWARRARSPGSGTLHGAGRRAPSSF
jgi:hypothetical protein